MNLPEIKRSDALFWAQLLSAVLSGAVSFLALRKFFAERGGVGTFALRSDLRKYYYMAIAIIILLVIGIILYFRMVSKQIGEADDIDNASQNPLLDTVDLANIAVSSMAKSGTIGNHTTKPTNGDVLLVRVKKI